MQRSKLINELKIDNIPKEILEDEANKMNSHELSTKQQQLDDLIKNFATFEEKGLGKTHLDIRSN